MLLNNINENNINNIKDLIGDVYFDFDIKNYGTLKNNNLLCINKYFLNSKPQKNELYEKCIDENTIIDENEKVALNNSIEFVINDSETKIKNLINDKEVAYKFNDLNQLIEIDDE